MSNKISAAALAMFIGTGGAIMFMNQPMATTAGISRAITIRCPTAPDVAQITSQNQLTPTDYMTKYSVMTCMNPDVTGTRLVMVGDRDMNTQNPDAGYPLYGGGPTTTQSAPDTITLSTGGPMFCSSPGAPGNITCMLTLF